MLPGSFFAVFEGGDGAGKSTQARALLGRLRRRGVPALLTREPGGTTLGESVRRWLKSHRDTAPMAELLLFSAARAQLVQHVIRPALSDGVAVICDRFTASTVAYQGWGRGLDLAWIDKLNQAATGGLAPDLTILLDLPPEAALARRARSGDGPDDSRADRFEAAPLEFHRKVRQGYLGLAASSPRRWLVLDAASPPQLLARQVWEKVQPLL
ncbi:MAG: dTMP kinase [Dehalococcoidia bacterium]|nr:dTMP kinase [Dehalococcoidia bacterium]MSQ16682.1 dTMP kinase [Dehalococcoidia bacterium]